MDTPAKTAPKRIWLLDYGDISCTWCEDPDPDGEHGDSIEYVRADVAKTVPREATEKMRAAGLPILNDNFAGLNDIWMAMYDAAPPSPPLSAEKLAALGVEASNQASALRHAADEVDALVQGIVNQTAKVLPRNKYAGKKVRHEQSKAIRACANWIERIVFLALADERNVG